MGPSGKWEDMWGTRAVKTENENVQLVIQDNTALMKRSLAKAPNSSSKPATASKSTSVKSTKTSLNFADYNIYCDGACSPNPGKSGSGIAIYEKEQVKQHIQR